MRRSLPVVALLAALTLLHASCARLVSQTAMSAQPLEKPRVVAEVRLPPQLVVSGQREGLVVHAQAIDQLRCADDFRQRVRGVRTTTTRAQGQSLLGEWLIGAFVTALGGAGVAWTAAHPAAVDEDPNNQPTRYLLTGVVAAIGLGTLAAATKQQLEVGVHTADLGERELQKTGPARPCGQSPRGGEALRLTLVDGRQLEATTNANGQADFALPPDLDERMADSGSDRATLEARSDAKAQTILHLQVK